MVQNFVRVYLPRPRGQERKSREKGMMSLGIGSKFVYLPRPRGQERKSLRKRNDEVRYWFKTLYVYICQDHEVKKENPEKKE